MIAKAKELSVDLNIEVKDGIYLGLSYFETLAEYNIKFLVNCVGMSTVLKLLWHAT
jgi:purine-nucleoside phosphorylase